MLSVLADPCWHIGVLLSLPGNMNCVSRWWWYSSCMGCRHLEDIKPLLTAKWLLHSPLRWRNDEIHMMIMWLHQPACQKSTSGIFPSSVPSKLKTSTTYVVWVFACKGWCRLQSCTAHHLHLLCIISLFLSLWNPEDHTSCIFYTKSKNHYLSFVSDCLWKID